MKTFISLLIILLISSNIYSQFVITSVYNPVNGDYQMNVSCDTTNINEGNPGTNQTWNFPSLIRKDSTLINWLNASSTPYSSSFPTANIASTSDNSNFNYFTASSSGLIFNGIGNTNLVVVLSDPETYVQYPFTFNSNFSDNFYATIISGTNTIIRNGTVTVTCDGWGTINLPFGSFSNALRVKVITDSRDSTIAGITYVLKSHATSYQWYVPGRKFDVFQISNTIFTYNGVPESPVKSVSYNSNSRSVNISKLGTEIPENFSLAQNYPNPFNPSTNIKFDIPKSSFVKIIVYDLTGRETEVLVNQQMQPGSYSAEFNGTSLSSGIYFYKISAGEFTETKKMSLIK